MIEDRSLPGRDPDRIYRGIIPAEMSWDVILREWGHEKRLNPRYDIANHSPDGYAWGYGGSAPSQLALAILVDVIGRERAVPFYQRFKFAKIATLPQDEEWTMTAREVQAWYENHRND